MLPRLLVLLLISGLAALPQGKKKAQGGKKAGGANNPEAQQVVDLAAAKTGPSIAAERVSDPEKQSDWPSACYAADGSQYTIYIEWDDKQADRVLVRRKSADGKWAEPVAIDDKNWDHYSPAIVGRKQGALALWSGQVDGNFELYAGEIGVSGKPGRITRLTHAPMGDFNARAVSDAAGNVTVVWQSFRNGNADVYARKLTGAAWGREVKVSVSDASDWEPAVALSPQGVAWISWDTYDKGNYDVMLRSFDGAKLGDVIAMTTEPSAQFHSSVAVDGEGKVWVAWDDAGINWGKDFSTSSSATGSRGLHYSRMLGLRVYANGRVQEPAADLRQILTGRMERYAELPHLLFDKSGSLWMVFRHWTLTKPNEIYHFYATHLTGNEWSLPQMLESSSGHNTQKAGLALNPSGGLSVVYASDGRSVEAQSKSQAHALHYNVYAAALPAGGGVVKTALADVKLPTPQVRPPRRPRATMTAAGKTYKLMLGDCHRHTDIRGHSGVDGSVLDTYRYAIDAAQLDFLGTSDHNEVTGGRWPDGLRDYQWWYVQKTVDLMTHGPNFIGMYSYEHSMIRPAGHRNVLFLKRGAPLRMIDRERNPEDSLPPNMWKWWEENVLTQRGQKSVIVPHTFAAGPLADWNWPNARFDCLLEMYQGARGSYEVYQAPKGEKRGRTQVDEDGHYAQNALAKGNTYGFVSFSDHGSTHNSWAGVWSLTEDRAGIMDGMYDRRTFAASDEIIFKVSADGHMPGSEFNAPVNAPPRITAMIDAPDELLRIDVIKDGKIVYTSKPTGRHATLDWRDNAPSAGRSYYYVRVFQRDTEGPDNDPEIGWASPFYVTYK
jgi:hypothetical protein